MRLLQENSVIICRYTTRYFSPVFLSPAIISVLSLSELSVECQHSLSYHPFNRFLVAVILRRVLNMYLVAVKVFGILSVICCP